VLFCRMETEDGLHGWARRMSRQARSR
jgi:hypothetical protein